MPANDEQIRIGLSVQSDSSGAAQARKDLQGIKRGIEELGVSTSNNLNRLHGRFDTFHRDIERGDNAAIDLLRDLERLDGVHVKPVVDVQQRVNGRNAGGIGQGLDRAGMIGSQVLSGLGSSEGANALGLIGDLGGAISSLNPITAGLTFGMAGLGLALQEVTRQADETSQAEKRRVDAIRDARAFLDDATREEAEARIADLQRDFNREQTLLQENRRHLDDYLNGIAAESVRTGTEAAGAIGTVLGTMNGEIRRFVANAEIGGIGGIADQTRQQIEAGEAATESLASEMAELVGGLAAGATAANDAAAAERRLANERTQGLLNDALQAGELAQLRDRAAELTREQLDAELESINRRRIGVEAELAVLEQSGDVSAEVSRKLAQLRDSLGHLGEQAEALRSVTPVERDSGTDAARELERAAQDVQKASNDAARAQDTYSDRVRDVSRRSKDAAQDIGIGLRDSFEDNNRELRDRSLESTIEFNQEQLQEQREFERDLAGIRREAGRDALQATRERDFAALRDVREREAVALDERKRAEADENADQLIAQRDHLSALGRERDVANRDARIDALRSYRDADLDRSRAYRDARADLNSYHRDRATQEQTFMRASLSNWQSYFQQLNRLSGSASGGGSGASTSGTNRTPTFDDLEYAFGGS